MSSRSRARIKDLEAAIATLQKQRREMMEDIDLYKLDIVGFKKDLARRDAHLHDLQFSPEIDAARAAHARTIEDLRAHRASANAVVARRDAEIARLETVVAGLKLSISANTRVEEAVGDEVFRDSWGRIGYDVMNWCLANGAVKGGAVDMQKLDDATREELLNTVPAYEKLIKGGHRVHVVQSLVAARLIREVFGGWFLGLSPERDGLLRELEKDLAETCKIPPSLPPPMFRAFRLSGEFLTGALSYTNCTQPLACFHPLASAFQLSLLAHSPPYSSLHDYFPAAKPRCSILATSLHPWTGEIPHINC